MGSAVLGIVSGVLGAFAVLRKQSLLGDAVSHAALPGIALVFLFTGSKAPIVLILGALAAGWIISLATGPAGVAAPSAELAYLMGRSVVLVLDPAQTVFIILLCFVFAGLASFIPALRASSLNPAQTIRNI